MGKWIAGLVGFAARSATDNFGQRGASRWAVDGPAWFVRGGWRGSWPVELSYTQNLEDYHLSLAFAGQKAGTYIDVGAGHPIADNVSFWFYERGWQGIVIEPQL